MSKTLLIAGNNFSSYSKFVVEAQSFDRSIFKTEDFNSQLPKSGIIASDVNITDSVLPQAKVSGTSVLWNRASPISARSVIIKAESETQCLDESVLIFDAPYFASVYKEFSTSSLSKSTDDMILGFNYLSCEILKRYVSKKNGCLVFLLKSALTPTDVIRGFSHKSSYDVPASIPVSVAQQSFIALAENIAGSYSGNNGISVFLVKCDSNIDESVASWLFPYIDSLKDLNAPTGKNALTWLKVGVKPSSGFKLFKK